MKRQKLIWLVLGLALMAVIALSCSGGTAPTPTPVAAAKSTAASPSPTATAAAKPTTPAAKPSTSATGAPLSFAGKTATIIVPASAGGSIDIVGRIYAKFLPKYLPGKPSMVVRQMPGGGSGIIGGNYAYEQKPDGLTLLISGGVIQLSQLIGQGGVRYDIQKMTPVVACASANVIYAKPTVVDKPENLLKAKGIIFGHMAGALGYTFTVSKELLDFPADKVILAYGGTGDARRAFFAGEITVSNDNGPGYLTSELPYVQKGEIIALYQGGILDDQGNLVKDPGLPADILTVKELYEKLHNKPPSGIKWDAFKSIVAATANYNNLLMLGPGTPDNIKKAYWDAAAAMLKDADYLSTILTLVSKETKWMTGESLDKGFKENCVMKPEVREWFRDTMKSKYGVVIE